MVDVDRVRGAVDMLFRCVAMVMVGVVVWWIDDLNRMRWVCGGRGTGRGITQTTSYTCDCSYTEVICTWILQMQARH